MKIKKKKEFIPLQEIKCYYVHFITSSGSRTHDVSRTLLIARLWPRLAFYTIDIRHLYIFMDERKLIINIKHVYAGFIGIIPHLALQFFCL